MPHWEQTPADLPDAIRQTKAALRARIAASGRTVEEVFAVVQDQIAHEVGEITAARERGEMIWPVIDFADIDAGTVPAGTQDQLRRRGCLVVRGHFDREQALSWDRGIVDYVEGNRSSRTTAAPAMTSSAASAPGPRSTPSTGRPPRCRPGRVTGWRGCRRS